MAVAFRDGYPVTPLHTLVKPKRHVADYFDLYQPDLNAINQLLQKLKGSIVEEDDTVTGFNVGVNAGESAGQTVFHCHVHLIHRRTWDVDDPRGGVRGVIAAEQKILGPCDCRQQYSDLGQFRGISRSIRGYIFGVNGFSWGIVKFFSNLGYLQADIQIFYAHA